MGKRSSQGEFSPFYIKCLQDDQKSAFWAPLLSSLKMPFFSAFMREFNILHGKKIHHWFDGTSLALSSARKERVVN